MEVHVRENTNFSLGNPAHLAPEVITALARKGRLARGSDAQVVIPLAAQGAFAAGVVLYELAMGLEHPLVDYPALGNSEEAFGNIDLDGLRDDVWSEYADVAVGLLAFHATHRLSLGEAHRRLAAVVMSAASASGIAGRGAVGALLPVPVP